MIKQPIKIPIRRPSKSAVYGTAGRAARDPRDMMALSIPRREPLGWSKFRYEHDFRHKASDEPGEHTAVRTTIPRQRYVFLIPGFFHHVTLGNCRPASSKVSEPIVNSIKGVSRMANASLRPS
ncbi:unnamed protein product [Aspergillus oryzae]|uniref:Unnamed protein product n=2 Tax=Aspergillus oryzae TaxID=5062 RepID=A0AAN4YQH3_ASPOZ|nr:unnamed protein product [Aspergillus oryzae]GMF89409.1 unnamed protein product [Aspergillus oryzae]GMG08569.1 unnamed protein product [Aspergillus oryzae]GMG34268.1 unnamed protein product [Aspergillus oryzae]GMG53547.1 unnamed protein product [Aspergillus oryzae var. brunneus]